MRQKRQPFTQQRIDLLFSEPVADGLQRRRVIDCGEPVIQRLEGDAGLGGLAFGPLVAVEAQLGVVREIGAELEEERPEIVVEAIEVELVDQPGGLHDPRVGVTVGVAAFLGAEQARLLLRPTDEQHPLGAGEPGQVLVHDVVLALPLGEIHPRHTMVAGEPVHRFVERLGDPGQRRGRGDRQLELPVHVADQATSELQLRHIDVAVHAVDAVDLEDHVLGQDIADSSRYGHDGLRSIRAAS